MLSGRLLLRAELDDGRRHVVGHTTALTTGSAQVRTDERFSVGDCVRVQLSFAPLLPVLALDARVVATDPGLGHGYHAGVSLEFSPPDVERRRLDYLLSPADVSQLAGAPFRILVVEDSALIRDFVQVGAERFLRQPRWLAVDTVENGDTALRQVQENRYDLVLVDLYLPGSLDGAALVRRLRELAIDASVIGFSVGGDAARVAFLAAGADMFLDKPVMLRDVFATLERLWAMRTRVA